MKVSLPKFLMYLLHAGIGYEAGINYSCTAEIGVMKIFICLQKDIPSILEDQWAPRSNYYITEEGKSRTK